MFKGLKHLVRTNLINIPGWRTDRKIIVIESDDWGSIRMSSKENLAKLVKSGINVLECPYLRNDALASEDDLTALFEVLANHQDSKGRNPVITANVIMTNPDFYKIASSDFTEYFYELFTETLSKYSNHRNSFELWKQGIKEELFYPQFHGREHLQVLRWLHFLKNGEYETKRAFEVGVFGVSTTIASKQRKSFMAAYDWDNMEGKVFVQKSIREGLYLFKSHFGFESLSAIAPNYIWHPDVEQKLNDNGVRFIQGTRIQKSPNIETCNFDFISHFTGQNNKLGQTYLVRNCTFEPALKPSMDWVDKCMRDIKASFYWKKPAIISTHRVNFIGYINSNNREQNLTSFNNLLKRIIQKWPDVEFMTSDQLGMTIENDE